VTGAVAWFHWYGLAAAKRPIFEEMHPLIVAPKWDDRGAWHALWIAAMPSNVKSAATILCESEDRDRAGLLAHWDDDGGTNRSS
jgi:hypothetical protein